MQSLVSRSVLLRAKRKFAKRQIARERKQIQSVAKQLTQTKLGDRFRASINGKVKSIKSSEVAVSSANKKIFLTLNDGDKVLAKANISVHIHGTQLIAVIEQIQGVYGRKRELDSIKTANKKAWNILLVKAAIEAAKAAGFTKILFRDITTSRFYRKPNIPFHEMLPSQAVQKLQLEKRRAMETLYKSTARECGFKIREGHYYVQKIHRNNNF